jgi:hypothetical protein
MSITRLTGGLTPGDGADPRTFPAIWNATADVLDDAILPTGGSAGQVLVKDSATDYDADWRFGFGGFIESGFWHNAGTPGASTGVQPAVNSFRMTPWFISEPVVLNGLAIRIGTSGTGSVGAVFRIGVYGSDSKNLPTDLLLDAGTVDATQPTGTVLAITGLSLSLNPGVYWMGGAVQGSPATVPFIQTNDRPYQYFFSRSNDTGAPTAASVASFLCRSVGGVTGALPSTITSGVTNNPPQIMARFD